MFDVLPGRLGEMPAFHPVVVDYKPKMPIGVSIAQGISGLAKALDPEEAAKRKFAAQQRKFATAQMSNQLKMMEDYNSGKFDKNDFVIDEHGMVHRKTEAERLAEKLGNEHLKAAQQANDLNARKSITYGQVYDTTGVPTTNAPPINNNPDDPNTQARDALAREAAARNAPASSGLDDPSFRFIPQYETLPSYTLGNPGAIDFGMGPIRRPW